MAGKDSQSIDNVIEEILDYQVDGIIAASVSMSSGLSERCRNAGVPMVLFNRAQDEPNMSAITSDNIEGGKKIAKFLISSGHKKISYIAGHPCGSGYCGCSYRHCGRSGNFGRSSGGDGKGPQSFLQLAFCCLWTVIALSDRP